MNKSIEIKIPGEIVALNLTLPEKVVLAHIHKFPGCSNGRLAELASVTCRGVESMLSRLRHQGYISQTGKGRARRHHLLFHVEHHIECGNPVNTHTGVKSPTPRGDRPATAVVAKTRSDVPTVRKEMTWYEELDYSLGMIGAMMTEANPFPDALANFYGRALKRVVEEAPDFPEKEKIVRELTRCRNGCTAIFYGTKLPKEYQRQAAQLIRTATPEKLEKFYRCVESGKADGGSPLLLSVLGDAIEI